MVAHVLIHVGTNLDIKGFASTYDTQTEKVNTRDQVKTAGSPGESRPNLLVQIYFHHQDYDGRCNIRHYNTRIRAPSRMEVTRLETGCC